MGLARKRPGRRGFLLYVPNATLSEFHNRSPWLMLPRSFQALGYASTLVCAKLTTARTDQWEVVQTGLAAKALRPLLSWDSFKSLLEPLLTFRQIALRKPDLVIVSPIRSSLITFLTLVPFYRGAISSSTRFILKTDSNFDNSGADSLRVLLSNILLSLASRILDLVSVETSCGVERARRLPGIVKSKVVHVPIGFPQGLIPTRTHEEVDRAQVILCVARIARMKGQDVLLRAFSLLAEEYPTWSVHLAGPEEDGKFKQELVDFIEQHDLKGRVEFTGFIEQSAIDEEYAHAAIFCLPSLYSESAGQVKFEATACGLPVVTTDVPCGRDAVELGWYVAPAGDSAALATHLEALMRDNETRRIAVRRAQSRQISYEGVALHFIRESNEVESALPTHLNET